MTQPEKAQDRECSGFRWIGQTWRSCDRCGRPAWDHVGMEVFDGAFAFGGAPGRVELWTEGRWDTVREAWARNALWERGERFALNQMEVVEVQYGVDFPKGGKVRRVESRSL